MKQIKERTPSAKYVAFKIDVQDNLDYGSSRLSGVQFFGISEQFKDIQPIEVNVGRYISDAEFDHGSNVMVIGVDVAKKLFGSSERAIGKEPVVRGKKFQVIGVIKKQGQTDDRRMEI